MCKVSSCASDFTKVSNSKSHPSFILQETTKKAFLISESENGNDTCFSFVRSLFIRSYHWYGWQFKKLHNYIWWALGNFSSWNRSVQRKSCNSCKYDSFSCHLLFHAGCLIKSFLVLKFDNFLISSKVTNDSLLESRDIALLNIYYPWKFLTSWTERIDCPFSSLDPADRICLHSLCKIASCWFTTCSMTQNCLLLVKWSREEKQLLSIDLQVKLFLKTCITFG